MGTAEEELVVGLCDERFVMLLPRPHGRRNDDSSDRGVDDVYFRRLCRSEKKMLQLVQRVLCPATSRLSFFSHPGYNILCFGFEKCSVDEQMSLRGIGAGSTEESRSGGGGWTA